MEAIFGVPMNSIMVIMLGLLALCLLVVVYIAWRRPVIFRLGVRNIPRRKTQSLLIVIGLMLATLIMSASLATGDSLNHSINSEVFDLFGPVDEFVVVSSDEDGEGNIMSMVTDTMPAENVEVIRGLVADAEVDAVGGVLLSMAPVLNMGQTPVTADMQLQQVLDAATASNPEVYITGVTQDFYDAVGGMNDHAGNPVDLNALASDEVYISVSTAGDLHLAVGDSIGYVLNNQVYGARVIGIVDDSLLAGGVNP